MAEEEFGEIEVDGEEEDGSAAWNMLTPEQKKQFKKLTEKTKEKMSYIG